MKLLYGLNLAKQKSKALSEAIAKLKKQPTMVVVQVGNNSVSQKYIQLKLKKASSLGIQARLVKLAENISFNELRAKILKALLTCDGMIIQLPLPQHLPKQKVLDLIPQNQDIDGLATNNNLIVPATPQAICALLDAYKIKLHNQKVAVIGQSTLVGKPFANLAQKQGAIVSRYDITTGINDLDQADIVVSCVGKPNLITALNLKKEVIIIDVGISHYYDLEGHRHTCGDIDRKDIETKAQAITPIIGGVGPLTVIYLFENLVKTIIYNQKNSH